MSSLAEHHRESNRRSLASMSAAERVALCFELGDADLEIFRRANGFAQEEALTELRLRRQVGRTPCSFLEKSP